MKPAVVAEPQRDPRLGGRLHRGLRVGLRQRKRLLAEDVFLRLGRRDDLRAVQRVRRRQHHRVHRRIRQRLLVGFIEGELLLRRELFMVVGLAARDRRDELQVRTNPLDGLHEGFAPPAESDLRGADHLAMRSSDHFGSAATLSVSGSPSSFFTTLTPCTSATIL